MGRHGSRLGISSDEWVLDEFKANPRDYSKYSQPSTCAKSRLLNAISQTPRLGYLIFADQASVDSVVECTEEMPSLSERDYWFTVVATGLRQPQIFYEDDHSVWIRDYEDDEDDEHGCRKALYQKVKATDLVGVIIEILDDAFVDTEVGDDGVSRVW